jgi:hypothetical protein
VQGIPITRNWVVMMRTGTPAVDWGGGTFLDVLTGQFFQAEEKDVSHRALNSDLDWLKHIGRVEEYDVNDVFFVTLPNLNRSPAEEE